MKKRKKVNRIEVGGENSEINDFNKIIVTIKFFSK